MFMDGDDFKSDVLVIVRRINNFKQINRICTLGFWNGEVALIFGAQGLKFKDLMDLMRPTS